MQIVLSYNGTILGPLAVWSLIVVLAVVFAFIGFRNDRRRQMIVVLACWAGQFTLVWYTFTRFSDFISGAGVELPVIELLSEVSRLMQGAIALIGIASFTLIAFSHYVLFKDNGARLN